MRVIIVSVLIAMLWISAAYSQTPPTYSTGPYCVQGSNVSLTVDSYDSGLMTDGTHSEYWFFQSDGADFSFAVTNPNKTVDYAYLYFGDGTGQLVSPNTTYSHTVGMNSDFIPALVVVYTDSTSEEVLGPCMYECFSDTEVYANRPTSFTPPVTQYAVVNSYLSNNSHTVARQMLVCYCGLQTDICGHHYSDYNAWTDPSNCKHSNRCLNSMCP
jgi:hypothetical protein